MVEVVRAEPEGRLRAPGPVPAADPAGPEGLEALKAPAPSVMSLYKLRYL